ncbi:UDP-N-acetylmuramoyl-L-alanyl-D-glutamate--2,6-diaminopimelate ligase [Gracilibacillus halotolerans]|nr:UDP-N-acetylmuramoyl-L-alanyl-D-glutamate--2,6-diaminopimelate ligase [Gracilibacillus halotolerans]
MNLQQLIEVLPEYKIINKDIDSEITSVEIDSREIIAGSLFICIEGYTVDGHDYVETAVKNGAVAIISEKKLSIQDVPIILVPDTKRALPLLANNFYAHPSQRFRLIGVTGTNGKTSVSHYINEILRKTGQKTGLIGTIEMKINETSYPVKNTTPDALFLQKSFNKMNDAGAETVTMEVSSHALDLGRVHGSDFDIAVFTNLSQDHLDFHGTMDNYLVAKSLLFSQLGNTYNTNRPKFAIINNDDKNSDFLKRVSAQPILTYGIHTPSTFQAYNIQYGSTGVSFDMQTPEGNISINSHLMGEFSVYNMLAAATCTYACGIPLESIQRALEKMDSVKGRFQPIANTKEIGVIVDYAHTPDSLKNVLKTIKQFCNGKIHVVVGCGGDRDRTKRPLMAQAACELADLAIFTSDNPRSEDPAQILNDMTTDLAYSNFKVIEDRESAIRDAIKNATANDIVLIAGKGHETYQILGNQTIDFDDAKIAAKYLEKY